MREAKVTAADLEAISPTFTTCYGWLRTPPQKIDGSWFEVLGPDDPGYAKARDRFEQAFKDL